MKKPYAIAVVGNSGAGKTTLLERLIPALKGKGHRVGVIKHDAHRFDIDHPGKDSHRLTAAGADTMMITSAEKLAMVKRHAASPPIEELLERYFSDMDLVLVEGFRGSSLPKIEVHRRISAARSSAAASGTTPSWRRWPATNRSTWTSPSST